MVDDCVTKKFMSCIWEKASHFEAKKKKGKFSQNHCTSTEHSKYNNVGYPKKEVATGVLTTRHQTGQETETLSKLCRKHLVTSTRCKPPSAVRIRKVQRSLETGTNISGATMNSTKVMEKSQNGVDLL